MSFFYSGLKVYFSRIIFIIFIQKSKFDIGY